MPIRKLKDFAHSILEKGSLKAYQRPQIYRCRYETRVKNLSEEEKEFFLLIPIPSNRYPQKLLSSSEFRPAEVRLSKEAKFENHFAVWTTILGPEQAMTFSQFFDCRVEPFKKVIDPNFSIHDYPASNQDVSKNLSPGKKPNEEVKELALTLSKGSENVAELIQNFNSHIIQTLQYGDPIEGLYSAQDALSKERVDCGGYNSLLMALCQAVGIPARIVSGFWAGGRSEHSQENEMHAWVEILLPDGHWLPADPSTEQLRKQRRSRKSGRLGFVGSDRIIFSYGSGLELGLSSRLKIKTDILQNPIIRPKFDDHEIVVERTFYTKKPKRILS
ncbi:MAG: transglutaminase-like domain-containing protein [Candidatus Harrisonbacteria bacterium]|nr:transglutaminase-like domain-containing protein [Candidatus Harrisonbacteria bacterium]